MRGYIATTPFVLSDFLAKGSCLFQTAYATTSSSFGEIPEVDGEEREFELSLLAAQDSRLQQVSSRGYGFVLAVELLSEQIGNEIGDQIELLAAISWDQVDSLLVSVDAEPELSWYARQEIAEHIQQWIA